MSRRFDAIVIGSGLGGLTAAALVSSTGRRVLVLERASHFGGAATVYQHGGLMIEASLHEIDGLDENDPKTPILRAIGITDELHFVPVGDLYEVRSPLIGDPFVMPHGLAAALSATTARFPRHAKALRDYFERLRAVRDAGAYVVERQDEGVWGLINAAAVPWRIWPLLRDLRASVGDVLRRLFNSDEAVKLALAANLGYHAENPERLWFLFYAVAQASFHIGGGHYVKGGSRSLTDRLVHAIRTNGGVLESSRHVTHILLEEGRAAGVAHEHYSPDGPGRDPQRDFAPVLFGNAAPAMLAGMLPEQLRPSFMVPYAGRRLSVSLWTMSLGFSRRPAEFGVKRYTTAVMPEWVRALSDLSQAAEVLAGDPAGKVPPFMFVDYSLIDSGLNPNPPYLGALSGIDRLENWEGLSPQAYRDKRERWLDFMIQALDREYPGLASAVVHREMNTARSMQAHLNTPGGAVYGFAQEPPDIRSLPLTTRTKIDGLFLASAYSGRGGGYTGAILGGAAAARAALQQIGY